MTLIELLKESAEKFSSKTALKFQEKSWNYLELYETVLKIAASFQASGIKKGDKVALLLKNSPEFVWTVFALSALGAQAVPLNFFLKSEEILYIFKDCGVKALVTQSPFLETIKEVQKNYSGLNKIWVVDTEKLSFGDTLLNSLELSKVSPKLRALSLISNEDETVLILYTSGTTGKSKGVMLSHKNLISNALSSIEHLDLREEDRFMCLLPMFHVFAWTTNVLIPLRLGAFILIIESIRPPKPWIKKLSQEKITIFAVVPQVYSLLAQQAQGIKRWVLKFFFRTVRCAISGAAPLPKEVAENFEKRIGIPILEGYGLTETSPVTNANTLKARKLGTVGKTIHGVEVKIIDEQEKELPQGGEGEICIRGHNIMQGYYNLPEETKNCFTKDGWFKTGDIGRLDSEGFLTICDRIKDMIIVKGLKVFSAQVEQVLLNHPKVAEVAVIGLPTADGDEIVKAYVVPKVNETLEKEELRKICQEKLPPYKRPREIEFLKELPKNALQKVLKRELRKMAIQDRHSRESGNPEKR